MSGAAGATPRGALALGAAALLALNLWAWRDNLALGFTDTDALADYAAARAEGLGGWARQLWTPLTGGVGGSNANFYRPVTMLHYAAMRAVLGDWTPGWQAWDLVLHGLAAALLGAVVRAIGGGVGAALGAAALFTLHPLAVEVVPAVARNLDTLMTVFALGAVLAAARGAQGLAVALGLGALGCKETAVVLPAVALLLWGRAGWRWLAAWAVGIGLFLVARTAVLEGLGGYYAAEQTLSPGGALGALARAAWECTLPGWSGPLDRVVPVGLRAPVGLGAVALAGALAARAWARGERRLAVGLALWALPVLLYGLTGTYSRRLLYLPTAGLALGVSGLGAAGGWARGGLALWALTLLPASPAVHRYRDWGWNDQVTRSLTTGVEAQLRALPPGSTVWVLDRCIWLNAEPYRGRTWKPGRTLNNCVASYSLQAWADDRLGPGHVRLRMLTSTQPKGPVPPPQVRVAPGLLVLEGPRLGRALTEGARAAGFEAEVGEGQWTLRVPPERAGEHALIAGGDAGVLLVLP